MKTAGDRTAQEARARARRRPISGVDAEALRDLFDQAPVCMHSAGPDGTILRANAAFLAFLGCSENEVIGHQIGEFYADRQLIGDISRRLRHGEIVAQREANMLAKGGRLRHVLIDASAFFRDAELVHMRFTTHDRSELRLIAELLEQTHDAVLVWGLHGAGILDWNAAAESLYGYSRDEAIGRVSHDLLATQLPCAVREFEEMLERDGTWFGEVAQTARDGRKLLVDTRLSVVRDASGTRVLETTKDITESRRNEEHLAELDANLRQRLGELETLFNLAPMGIAIASDAAANRIDVNPALRAMMGISEGENASLSVPAPDRPPFRVMRHGQDVAAEEQPMQVAARDRVSVPAQEFDIVRADGTSVTVFGYASPLFNEHGESRGSIGAFLDISDRKEIEQALRLSEEQYRSLAEALPALITVSNAKGEIVYCNAALLSYTGRSYEALRNGEWYDMFHPSDLVAHQEEWTRAIRDGKSISSEFRALRHDGVYRWHLGRLVPIHDDSGAVVYWIGAHVDIDDQKRVEDTQRFLGEATSVLMRSLDVESNIAKLAEVAVPLVADAALVYLADETGAMELAAAHSNPAQLSALLRLAQRHTPDPAGPSVVGEALRTGEVRVMRHVDDKLLRALITQDEDFELAASLHPASALLVPVLGADGVAGLMLFWMGSSGRGHDERDLDVARELQQRARIAIENVRLYRESEAAHERAERTAEMLRRVQSVSDATLSHLKLEHMLNELLQRVRLVLGTDTAAVLLMSDDAKVLSLYASTLPEEVLEEIDVPLGIGFAGAIAATLRPQVIEDVAASDVLSPALRKNSRSLLGVPLVVEARVIGVIHTGSRESRTFTDADIELLQLVADRLAPAIENARLYRQAQEALEVKDEFLGMVSHELKTPITTILGNAQILHRRGAAIDDESRAEALSDIAIEADRLHRIIENMLVLARVESARELQKEPFEIARLIEMLAQQHRNDHPGRIVEVETEKHLPFVSGEEGYVEQVMRNLFSNAEKYSPAAEPVVVRVRLTDGEIEVHVLDRGRGITEEDTEQIFTPFYRSPRTSGMAAGVGIGLAVCKRLVEAQDGRMWARQREDGNGADIGFTLPVESSVDDD